MNFLCIVYITIPLKITITGIFCFGSDHVFVPSVSTIRN